MEKSDSLLKMKVMPNGPILVKGTVELTLADGTTIEKVNPALCRCGATKNKPYCDGSHMKVGFRD